MPSSGPKVGVMHGVAGRSRRLTQSGIAFLSSSILSSETSRESCAMCVGLPMKTRPPVDPAALLQQVFLVRCNRLLALPAREQRGTALASTGQTKNPPPQTGEGFRSETENGRETLFRGVLERRLLLRLEHRSGLFGDPRPLEEARVLRAPQPDRIGEDEVVEIALRQHPILDQLIGFRQRLAHVDNIEMADIGAVDRVELSAERIELQERGRVHPVVRL